MTIIEGSIAGQMHGASGKYIYYTVNGQIRMRLKPTKVRKSNSPALKSAQDKFNTPHYYIKLNKPLFHLGWGKNRKKLFAYNAAKSYLLKNACQKIGEEWELIPSKVMHAKGSLPTSRDIEATNIGNLTINFIWDIEDHVKTIYHNDTLCIVLYNITKKELEHNLTDFVRTAKACYLTLSSEWAGDQIAVYGFFVSPNKRSVSNDTYLGTITLQ